MSHGQHVKPNGSGIGRIIKATKCSFDGLASAWRDEAAFRQEMLMAVLGTALACWLAQSINQWLLLVIPLMALLVVEIFNSAIEAAIDRIGAEIHPLSKKAKDLGSAAVFITLLIIALCWGSVLYQNYLVG